MILVTFPRNSGSQISRWVNVSLHKDLSKNTSFAFVLYWSVRTCTCFEGTCRRRQGVAYPQKAKDRQKPEIAIKDVKECRKLLLSHKYGVKRTQETDSAVKVQLLDAGSVLVQRFLKHINQIAFRV